MKKALLICSAVVIQACLGTVYAFSVFVNPLRESMGWTLNQVSLAFTLCLASFTLFMNLAGRLQESKGPRLTASIGGLLLGLGLIGAGRVSSLLLFYLFYGVIGGAGIGFGYVTPISTLVKWFPERKGLMSGLAVFGFGAGPLIFAPIATSLIAQQNVGYALTVIGSAFLFLVVGFSQVLSFPESNKTTLPQGSQPSVVEIWKTLDFWRLWTYFFVGAAAGLMVISQAAPLVQELGNLDPVGAAGVVGVMAICNGLGRVLWGYAADRWGYVNILVLMYTLFAVDLLLLLPLAVGKWVLGFGVGLAAFCFGGFFSLMPALTSKHFGNEHIGKNYALVFTAYGVAALAGPMLISLIYTLTGGYQGALLVYGVAAAAVLLSLNLAQILRSLHLGR